LAALEILERGDIMPEQFYGSWSGAFGGTQFMPTTLLKFCVDFGGDGRRNIVGDIPDILASTANALRAYGWTTGRPCIFEVAFPQNYSFSLMSGRKLTSEWANSGIARVGAEVAMPQNEVASVLMPAGIRGPAFLVFTNFDAILRYNPAEAYAFAVCQLADRLRGQGPLETPWPRDERMLSTAERLELQSLLSAQGYDVGPVDGMIGARTRLGIRAFQMKSGLIPDGFATASLLEQIRHP
jgi:membrane-bound lytic murein transglycosylase B